MLEQYCTRRGVTVVLQKIKFTKNLLHYVSFFQVFLYTYVEIDMRNLIKIPRQIRLHPETREILLDGQAKKNRGGRVVFSIITCSSVFYSEALDHILI